MLRGGGNGARKGHGQGARGKRREREEAREGRGARGKRREREEAREGRGAGGKRRGREEAREGRGAGEAKDRTRNGAVPGRAHFGRAHNNINIMSRSGRARGKREEGTAEKTRGDGGEDKSGRRRRQEERSAGKTGGAVGGEDRRSGRRGRQEERTAGKTGGADGGEGGTKRQKNDRKRQKTAGCGPTTRRACNVWFTAHYARKTGVSAPADNRL